MCQMPSDDRQPTEEERKKELVDNTLSFFTELANAVDTANPYYWLFTGDRKNEKRIILHILDEMPTEDQIETLATELLQTGRLK